VRGEAEEAKGTLYLIPTPLGPTPLERVLPEETRRVAADLATFIVEHPKTARAFLKQLGTATPLQQLSLLELNEHTRPAELDALLAPLLAGHDVGLISEAGCPAVADPGADLVRLAHRRGIRVRPLVGPSSILLALMGSGLVGQRFAFHGYLPAKPDERARALRDLEKRAEQEDAAQVFIETPYRNRAMLDTLFAACRGDTWLGLAWDLTGDAEGVLSRRLDDWRQAPPDIDRRPCVFLLWRQR
jgi:16S rRNA (cytidine1402-2'-O)-methyltransferase